MTGARSARPGPTRLAGLDGVRGLALLAVVTYHFAPQLLPGGFAGVDVFFVLSGHLVTAALLREASATGALDLPAFLRRRLRRLYPALAALLVVVCATAWVWRDQLVDLRPATLSAALFAHNWWLITADRSYFADTGRPSALEHLWSLGIEGQFYLLWPALLALVTLPAAWRRPDREVRPARAGRLALLLAVASSAAMTAGALRRDVPYADDGSDLYFSSATHGAALMAGAALACWTAGRSGRPPAGGPRRRPVPGATSVAGVLALGGLVWFCREGSAYSPWTYRVGFPALAVLGAVVVHAAGSPGTLPSRVLGWAPLRWLGVRSYSAYLWHWPVAVVTRPGLDGHLPVALDQALRVALTLALTVVSHRWLEDERHRLRWRALVRPLRRVAHRAAGRRTAAGPAVLAPALALVVVLAAAGAALTVGPGHAPGPPVAFAAPAPAPAPVVPATPAPGGAPQPATASVFGDSVLLGAEPALRRVFDGGVSMDAVVGRQPGAVLRDLTAGVGSLEPTVVLQVGNNGAVDPEALTGAVRAVAAQHHLVLLTVGVDRPWRRQVNDAVLAAAAAVPSVAVVRWDRLARAHPEWLAPDGLHVNARGAAGLADAVRRAEPGAPG